MAAALLQKLLNNQAQPTELPLLAWTILHRRLLDPKTPFSLADHLYLVEIYQQTAREMTVKKAAQLGLSEWLVSYALHGCDQRGLDVIYIMPTNEDVSDFSQTRFGPALEASPYLESIVVAGGDPSGKRGSDKVMLKRIRDSFLYFRGGQVSREGKARQLKSIPADAIILDELDEMDPRTPEIARKRLGHSAIAEVRSISTPTYPGVGIDAVWQQSDQREWQLKCGRCGEWQYLTINHIVTEWDSLGRPVAWHGQKQGQPPYPACQKCGQEINRLAPGQWVARFPDRPVVGYHPTKLLSPLADLAAIVQNLHTTDETKRRETINQDLGETYTPRGGQLTDDILDDCRRDYAHGPAVGERPVLGVDVGRVLHTVIRGPAQPDNGDTPQRWAGEVDTWDELGRLMRRFNVKACVIDALPETTKAREFQAAWPGGVVWLAYYSVSQTGSKQIDPVQWDVKNGVVNLDRTRTLDQTFSRFYDRLNTLPGHARDIKDYYAHLKAPVRVIEATQSGQPVARYIESGPDHLAHAENYCQVAALAPSSAAVTTSRAVSLRNMF